jgi:hypothetical protein
MEQFVPLTLFVSKLWHCIDPFAVGLFMSVLSRQYDLLLVGLLGETVSSVLAWHELGNFSTTQSAPDNHGCSKHW